MISLKLIKKRKFLIGTAVILCLIIVAIFNAYWVVYDYLFDNILTNVELKTVEQSVPFLQNLTVLLKFTNPPFPGAADLSGPLMRDLTRSEAAIRRALSHTDEQSFYSNQTTKEFSLVNYLDIAYFNRQAEKYDLIAVHEPWEMSATIDINVTQRLDVILRGEYLQNLVDRALDNVIGQLYRHYDHHAYKSLSKAIFLIDRLSSYSLAFTIPVALHLNKSNSKMSITKYELAEEYFLGDQTVWMYTHFDLFGTENWRKRTDTAEFVAADYRDITNTVIVTRITNVGVYDTRSIRSKKSCAVCGDKLLNVQDCVVNCKLQALVLQCQCIPFTYRRLFSKEQTNRTKTCTVTRYRECLNDKVGYGYADHCKSSTCVPCLTVNNNYATAMITRRKEIDTIQYFFLMLINVESWDYVLFEATYQNTLMETLGVLGGNLGLFLSFSLLGVWQFLEYIYEMIERKWRKKHHQQVHDQQNDQVQASSSTMVFSWLPRFGRFMASPAVSAVGKNEHQMNDDFEKTTTNRMGILENRADKFDKSLQEIMNALSRNSDSPVQK